MKRYRTILRALDEIKAADPQTDLTAYFLRGLVTSGAIPSRSAGKKYLISLEDVEAYLSGGFDGESNEPGGA